MAISKKPQATNKKDTGVAVPRESSWTQDPEDSPEEWDFRGVREEQLEAAIYYEYGRSCGWVREVFERWDEQRFPSKSKRAELRKWSGWTVRRFKERPDNGEQLPSEITKWFSDTAPPELDTHPLARIIDICPLFPLPFLKVQSAVATQLRIPKRQECPACWEEKGQGAPARIRLFNSQFYNAEEAKVDEKPNFLRHIVVDLRFSKHKVKKDFSKLVNELDDSKIEKLKLGKGRAGAAPWSRLKELAAYRLANIWGVKYANVRDFVNEYKRKSQTDDSNSVLPDYLQGSVSDAVKSVEQHMHTLFPKP